MEAQRKTKKDPNTLDPQRRRLWDLAEQTRGINLKYLSIKVLQQNESYVRDYLWRGSPLTLEDDQAAKLAEALGCNPAELKAGFAGQQLSRVNVSLMKPVDDREANMIRPGEDDLPIRGHVKAGQQGFFMDNGELQGRTERPGILRGVREAYATRVHDVSMEPVLRHGFLLWVDPSRPVSPGDEVVVQLEDGQAFIKTLVRRTAKVIRCKQYNPPKEIEYESVEVKNIHLVVGSTRVRA